MTDNAKDVLARRKQFIVPTATYYYEDPPVLTRGEMQYLYDSADRQYLDLFAGISTVSVGHANPEVTDKVVDQLRRLQHTSTIYLTEPMVDYAERLAQIAPGKLQTSWFTNSGTEANEGALLLAKRFTKRQEIVALKHSYHGRSWLAGSLTAQYNWRVDPMPVPGLSFAQAPYCYRCPFGQKPDTCGMECAKDVEETIKTTTNGEPAVFIGETILGVGGIITPPQGYWGVIRDICDRYGMLMIADEVQAGFGRTGKKWFGIEHWGVEPDFITMAKGMGNGIPIGGYITRPEIAQALTAATVNTYGGNPVSMAGGLAVIDYIEKHNLLEHVADVGDYFKQKLLGLQEAYPLIGEVRGMGLMLGVELVKDRTTKEPAMAEAKQLVEICKEYGVLIGRGGLLGNVIRIQPPLIITKTDVDMAVKVVEKALQTLSRTAALAK